MKSIVPYTKDIKFASKLAEICSISLEHEINIEDTEIKGNFIISGEYRSHKVSVNKEEFNFELPFAVDVTDNIDKDSIEFEVTDFTYEILDDETLQVDIEFCVTAEERKIEEEVLETVEIAEDLQEIAEDLQEVEEDLNERNEVFEEIDDLFLETPEVLEEDTVENNLLSNNKEEEEEETEKEGRLDQESADLILNSANQKDDEYTTYLNQL